jgi:hypothetical protein
MPAIILKQVLARLGRRTVARMPLQRTRAHARTGTMAGVQNHHGAAVGHRLNDNRGEMRQQHVKITFA